MSASAIDMARVLRQRAIAARQRAEERAAHLGTLLPRAAECLRRHGATGVWLFGSLAEGRPNLESDVDLAVEGLPALNYFDALAEVSGDLGDACRFGPRGASASEPSPTRGRYRSASLTAQEVQRLRAEIASDRQAFEDRLSELERLDPEGGSPATLAQVAVALHHAYGAVEAALARIARVLERSVPVGADWHAALLHAMTLEIPSVRPAVLTPKSAAALRKLLAFRHFFRHTYAVAWDAGQLASLRRIALDARPQVTLDFGAFDAVLSNVAAALDEE